LDLLLDERGSEGLNGLLQEVVLQVADGEIESGDFDDNVLDLEDGRLALGDKMDRCPRNTHKHANL
jgi:hypothetical protein